MRIKNFCRYSVPFALTLLVSACGGGTQGGVGVGPESSNNVDSNETPVELGEANIVAPAITVSGRVADGYIRGATVCVDINENDACDTDEPSTVTGEGGSYDLAVPEGHSDKPIVAAIPADAIDEDTGEAVGQALVFIAPADRPEFLSPITTLVHQEQRANPALSSEEAEQAVKSLLGIDEAEVSLFADYVAQSDATENTDGTAERFEYLHDTARVVASMMKDIENQVENAAVSKGVDVAGSEDTRRAIRDIVRNEVRELLPQIARQVAEIVGSANSASAAGSDTEESAFDPQALALSLRPEVEADSVSGRIEANLNRVETVESDLRSLLSDGVYWMEFDCHYDWDDEHSENSDSVGEQMDITMFPMPDCEAMYGRVQLTADGSELASEQYLLNVESGTWESPEHEEDDQYSDYSLINGEWEIVSSNGPDGQIEFLSSNSAVVTNDEGTMSLKSATQALDGSRVIHHLLDDGADPMWFDLIQREDIFPSESQAHRISVRQSYYPYVMFNFPGHESDGNNCVDFNGNCNVVQIENDAQPDTAVSLSQLRESSLDGVSLRTPFSYDTLMSLHGVAQEDGTLPNQGRVEWSVGGGHQSFEGESTGDIEYVDNDRLDIGDHGIDGIPEGPEAPNLEFIEGLEVESVFIGEQDHFSELEFTSHEECVAVLTEESERSDADSDIPTDLFAPGVFEGTRDELAGLIGERGDAIEEGLSSVDSDDFSIEDTHEHCSDIMSGSGFGVISQNDDSIESAVVSTNPEELDVSNQLGAPLNGRWKLIEIDGVEMIEVHLPLMFRDESDDQSDEAILLIEHDGFVRAGARRPDVKIDRVFTYNENAFVTLRSIVESGMRDMQ